MKGSSVLKKLSLLFRLLPLIPLSFSYGGVIENHLSEPKNRLFDYSEKINSLRSDILRKSWISPLMLNYSTSRTSNSFGRDGRNDIFTISMDQPIFKSGGIYSAIKYASALEGANSMDIELARRKSVIEAVRILMELMKLQLQRRQLQLLVENDEIDIKRKKEQYIAGIIDSSFLDQAILQRNRDKTSLLGLRLQEVSLLNSFRLLSDKDPYSLKIPRLKLIEKRSFLASNMEIERERLEALSKDYESSMTLSKYLPSLSVFGSYNDEKGDYDISMKDYSDSYYRVGLRLSMPININSLQDIEASRVEYLKSMVQLQEKRKEAENEYDTILTTISLIESKIALARSDEKLYSKLLKSTQELYRAGSKTKLDIDTLKNSMQMARLDAQVYELEKQIQLLKLYEKVNE